MKPKLAWGGFLDGKLDYWVVPLHGGGQLNFPAVFETKALGKLRYKDVRRVRIEEVQ